MNDITLYGHLTVDRIIDEFTENRTLGAMANVWKMLFELDTSLKIGLSPSSIGEALIYIDRETSERTSKAILNKKVKDPVIQKSKISHILYINEIPNINFIEKLDGIITTDICVGSDIDQNLYKYIDYFFISDEDLQDDILNIGKKVKAWAILHSKKGSVYTDGETVFEYNLDKNMLLDKSNVLGAGDMYAACFLYSLIKKMKLEKSIEFAHLKTTEYLRIKNEKI